MMTASDVLYYVNQLQTTLKNQGHIQRKGQIETKKKETGQTQDRLSA